MLKLKQSLKKTGETKCRPQYSLSDLKTSGEIITSILGTQKKIQ